MTIRILAATAIVPLTAALLGSSAVSGSAPNRCDQPGPYDLPHGSETVDLDPAEFTTDIDNPYWPMTPGNRWVFTETAPDGTRQHIDIVVTRRTRMISGIEARVVHDVATEHGELVENTYDWYAQDSGGTIWYLGEFTREYEDGEVVSTAGSFEHGADGAQAGVAVPAKPTPGCSYRQEYSAGVAEDRGRTLTTKDDIKVRGVRYRDVLSTSDRTPLEPFVLEHKFYASGVGPVEAVEVSPGASREVLVRALIAAP